VFVDDVPLVPGPPDLNGPLSLRIATVVGTTATINRVDLDVPSSSEIKAIETARSKTVVSSDQDSTGDGGDSK
jgi:hypothetical protein